MTISTTTNQTTLLGNGSTTVFDFNFVGDASTVLFVLYTDATGVQTFLSPSQYTLFLNPAAVGSLWGIGGTLTYPLSGPPIANGTSLNITRTLPLLQTVSISNQGDMWPTVTERAIDTLCMQIQQVSGRTGQLRGVWISGASYNFGDVVQDGINGADTSNYYMCVISNTSMTWATDLAAGEWSLAIDVQTIAGYASTASAAASSAAASSSSAASNAAAASTAAGTASTAATTASSAATTSTTAAGNAGSSASDASASASIASAAATVAIGGRYGTSTTSNTIGTGTKTFNTQAGLAILSGGFTVVSDAVTPANYLHGQVISYSTTTLVVNVLDAGGSGTITSWNISPSSPQGPSGSGTGTVNSGTAGQMTYYAGTGTTVSGNANATISTGALTLGQTGSVQGSVALSGSTSGTTTIAAPTSGGGTMTFHQGSGTLTTASSTDTLTNKTLTSSTNTLGGVAMTLGSDATGDIYYRSSGVLTRLPVGGANTVLHGGTTPAYSAVVEADITLADNTTNNVSTSNHGFQKKLPNDATLYADGTGNYTKPAGGILAAAYVTVSGTTPTLMSGTNIASVTYSGTTGNWEITFTNALSSTNYAVIGTGTAPNAFSAPLCCIPLSGSRLTTGFVAHTAYSATNSGTNPFEFNFIVV